MAAPCPMFGFLIEVETASLDASQSDAVLASLDGLLAARGLVRDGGRGARRWSYLILSEASQVTDADRHAVQDWAAGRPEIAAIHVGDIADIRGG